MQCIPRYITPYIEEVIPYYQVIVITGPRQVWKTTLARHIFPQYHYYNLEDPLQRNVVEEDPRGFIMNGSREMIIDEI